MKALFTFLLLVVTASVSYAQSHPQNSGTTSTLNSVAFTHSYHGVAVGDSGAMLHPTNGGFTRIEGQSGRSVLTNKNDTSATLPVCRLLRTLPIESSSQQSRTNAMNDSTPPAPPQNLRVITESVHSIMLSWDSASDPESGIDYYGYSIGSSPGAANIRYWQSTGLSLRSYSPSMWELGRSEGDTLYFSVRAWNGAGSPSSVTTSAPVVLKWENLGNMNNEIGIAYSSGWRQGERDSMSMFLTRMIPIIKEIYGPPSHSYTVTLVKDSNYSNTNVFFSGPNEVHMWRMYPQLLTHELIHAFRDNVVLANDSLWRYSPTLSGFEESFAQGVSYACMNRYVEEYPNGPIVDSTYNFGSYYESDYDFQNTELLTTTDFWSDLNGTGLAWLRYEMGAAAIDKIMKEQPGFPQAFNTLYYQRMNSDHNLRTSRDLMKDLISTVAPSIEGRETRNWIDDQHIFDCRIRTGRKIFVNTQHYPGWYEYFIFQRVFYYETFFNGSEWAYWDTPTSQWRYYSSNGSTGNGELRDWNGNVVWQRQLTIRPLENPPVYYGFGQAEANMTTANDTQPWPGGDVANFILNLHGFGLYWLDLTFGSSRIIVPRIMGDTLRRTTGVYGAILNTANGRLYIDHENCPPESSLTVSNGVFYGNRCWASIRNSRTRGIDSKPGRVFVRYVQGDGTVYRDERNIGIGSQAGTQLFLFDTRSMRLVSRPTTVSESDATPKEFSLEQNYPNPFNPTTTISFSVPSKSFVSLKVFDALGREVSILASEELPAGTYARQWNAAALPSGVYFYRLQAGSFTETKKLLLLR